MAIFVIRSEFYKTMTQLFYYLILFLSIAYMAVLFYYLVSFKKVKTYQDVSTIKNPIFISVIIPARNEAKNIEALLQTLLRQTYDCQQFEVIIVNDHSTDHTAEVLCPYLNDQIRMINLADHLEDNAVISYKKKAIEVGISSARGELIVTTDADCIVPEKWLETIASYFMLYEPVWMVMPVYIHPAKTFLQRFQSLDFMMLQSITVAAVSNNIHSMCNGANLAYTKNAFYEVGGFSGIDWVASGDDILLMEKMKERFPNKIGYVFSKEVIVQTKPVNTVKEFLHQRIRWAGKSKLYKEKKMLPVMFLVYFFNLGLLAGIGLCLTQIISPLLITSLLLMKMFVELLLLLPMAKFFGAQNQLWSFPLFQPIHILYTIAAGSFGMLRKYEWKGRQTK